MDEDAQIQLKAIPMPKGIQAKRTKKAKEMPLRVDVAI